MYTASNYSLHSGHIVTANDDAKQTTNKHEQNGNNSVCTTQSIQILTGADGNVDKYSPEVVQCCSRAEGLEANTVQLRDIICPISS